MTIINTSDTWWLSHSVELQNGILRPFVKVCRLRRQRRPEKMNKRQQTEAVGSFWIRFSVDKFEPLIFAKSDTASYQRPDTLTTVGPVQIPLTKVGRWVPAKCPGPTISSSWNVNTVPRWLSPFLLELSWFPSPSHRECSGRPLVASSQEPNPGPITAQSQKCPAMLGAGEEEHKSKDPQISSQCTCAHIPQMDARGSISPYPTLPRRHPVSICQSFWWVWVRN